MLKKNSPPNGDLGHLLLRTFNVYFRIPGMVYTSRVIWLIWLYSQIKFCMFFHGKEICLYLVLRLYEVLCVGLLRRRTATSLYTYSSELVIYVCALIVNNQTKSSNCPIQAPMESFTWRCCHSMQSTFVVNLSNWYINWKSTGNIKLNKCVIGFSYIIVKVHVG